MAVPSFMETSGILRISQIYRMGSRLVSRAPRSGVSGYSNPVFDITNNSLGVVRVLEFARQHRCPLIFFSTNRVYVVDRLLELPRSEAATRFEWDPVAWKKIPAGSRHS